MSKPVRFRGTPRLTPLAACLTALFGISASCVASAATWTVNSCSDGSSSGTGNASTHTGNLRFATLNAASGDTISLTSATLGCSKITLEFNFLYIGQNDLTIVGPGASAFTISGNGSSSFSLLNHTGSGTLDIEDLTIANGYYTGSVNTLGACIYSSANVTLMASTVTNCVIKDVGDIPPARGGAVFTAGNLTLINSTISDSAADASGTTNALGGGIYVKGHLISKYSTISGNTASTSGPSPYYSAGGGVFVHGYTHLYSSTISGNSAYKGGGIATKGNVVISGSTISGNQASKAAGMNAIGGGAHTALISDSTISGNLALGNFGGAYSNLAVTLSNSTIAFNQATLEGGLAAYGSTLDLQSSIIANNFASGAASDLYAKNTTAISGANNLIVSSAVTVPAGTITTCPTLGSLRDNGGLTFTHALLSHSSGIAKGNNAAALTTDQRGTGYPRVSAGETLPDIGAYEVQENDIIFNNAFDGCT